MVNPSQNVKKDNLTPERNRVKHIKEITNVGDCLNYNKTPKLENRKGIKIYKKKQTKKDGIRVLKKPGFLKHKKRPKSHFYWSIFEIFSF